jgi:hypothetical protein
MIFQQTKTRKMSSLRLLETSLIYYLCLHAAAGAGRAGRLAAHLSPPASQSEAVLAFLIQPITSSVISLRNRSH